jgi:hypothetical protein
LFLHVWYVNISPYFPPHLPFAFYLYEITKKKYGHAPYIIIPDV